MRVFLPSSDEKIENEISSLTCIREKNKKDTRKLFFIMKIDFHIEFRMIDLLFE